MRGEARVESEWISESSQQSAMSGEWREVSSKQSTMAKEANNMQATSVAHFAYSGALVMFSIVISYSYHSSYLSFKVLFTCVSSRHSQKCVTFLKLMTELTFKKKDLEHLFSDFFKNKL